MAHDSLGKAIASHAARTHSLLQTTEREDNRVWSPFTAHQAMGMLHAGAHGETAEALRRGCDVLDADDHRQTYEDLLLEIDASLHVVPSSGAQTATHVRAASRLWVAPQVQICAAYQRALKRDFGSDVVACDFAHPRAGAEINRWAADRTDGVITELGDAPAEHEGADDVTLLTLTTVVHLKGDWQDRFYKEASISDWTYRDGRVAPVWLMQRKKFSGFSRLPGVDVVDVPFEGQTLAMRLFVPRGGITLSSWGAAASGESLTRALECHEELKLRMPQFEARSNLDLRRALTRLGCGSIFEEAADFSAMSAQAVRVGTAVHQAFITIDEIGAEAGAATAITMVAGSAAHRPRPPQEITVDRPFAFTIHDGPRHPRGSDGHHIFFMGQVDQPRLTWEHKPQKWCTPDIDDDDMFG